MVYTDGIVVAAVGDAALQPSSSHNIKYTPWFVRQLHLALAPVTPLSCRLSPSHPLVADCYQLGRLRRRLQAVDCSSSSMSSAFRVVFIFAFVFPSVLLYSLYKRIFLFIFSSIF